MPTWPIPLVRPEDLKFLHTELTRKSSLAEAVETQATLPGIKLYWVRSPQYVHGTAYIPVTEQILKDLLAEIYRRENREP